MLARLILCVIKATIAIAVLIILGSIITLLFQGKASLYSFIMESVVNFNGLLVGGFGYGLLFFLKSNGKTILIKLLNIIELDSDSALFLQQQFNRYISWKRISLSSLPFYLIGSVVLINCGYPLHGFSKYYLIFFSTSIYFVASFIFFFFLFVIIFFMKLDSHNRNISIKKELISMDLNSFNMFFIITTTVGILALYLGFRGTLTATFALEDSFIRILLTLPIVLFMPTTLLYSFYPRYVLKKINEHTIIEKLKYINQTYSKEFLQNDTITLKDRLDFERNLMDLKDKVYSELKQFPVFSLRDSFSIFILIVFFIQFVLHNDPTISIFFKKILKII